MMRISPSPFKAKLLSLLFMSTVAFAQGPQDKQDQTWNFNNVDIQTLINRVSEETGKNFIVDPRVQAKITVISQQPLAKEEAYQAFLSILHTYGFNAIESGNIIKIVPEDNAIQSATPLSRGKTQSNDALIVKVLPINYLPAAELMQELKPLTPRTSYLFSNPSSNTLVITDTASNVIKIENIIKALDKPNTQGMTIIPLVHATATEIANTLATMLRQKGGSQNFPISLAADERTNSLLVSGGTPALRNYIKGVVNRLDSTTSNKYNSEVIYVQYVEAKNIAPIVATFLEEAMKMSEEQKVRDETKKPEARATAVVEGPGRDSNMFSRHLSALKNNQDTGGAQGSLFAESENAPKSGIINRFVQWEESSNALIVKAPPSLMKEVKAIISKLDIKRPQIMIEVIIAEVSLDRVQQYGVEWNGSLQADFQFATRLFNAAEGTAAVTNGIAGFLPGAGTNGTSLGQGLTVGIFRHGQLTALLKMLQSDVSANILSTPTLVTLDNQLAMIKVGKKVPFAVGQTNNQNTNGNPFTSFDREEVGLSLTIKPQVTPAHEVKLQIENIISDLIPGTENSDTGGNPTTTERSVITNVMVGDGKILVLGGLIQDKWSNVITKVPFIGSIPVLGRLFSKETKVLGKSNLMIFLKPTVLFDDNKGVHVSMNKYDQMTLTQLESSYILERPFINEPPILPPMNPKDPGLDVEVILPAPFE